MEPTTIRLETKKIAMNLSNMTKLIIKNHALASKAIKTNDKNLAIEILEKDKIVDAEFYQIESDLEFMITKALVDKDLRRVLASLHIVKELERIGNYAKKISKFIIKINKISASSIRRITKVQDKFKKMIDKIPKIIITEDTKLAKEIWNFDDEVDNTVHKLRKEVILSITKKSNKDDVGERVFLLNIINSFERACDHIVNICQLIQYIVTGQHHNL